jgi:predicted DCC family thiol-disulfide oxidoreductase YuxK
MGAMSRGRYLYRSDPSVPAFADDLPIIIFDGKCVFCSAFARFVLRADKYRRFRLMAAQTTPGLALYRHFGLDPLNYETNILLEGGEARFKSDASIRVFELLGFPWCLMSACRLIPAALRDRLYQIVARNRLRWFGVRDACFLPDPDQADRFLG